jgi:hypothetical protein
LSFQPAPQQKPGQQQPQKQGQQKQAAGGKPGAPKAAAGGVVNTVGKQSKGRGVKRPGTAGGAGGEHAVVLKKTQQSPNKKAKSPRA